jgi:hypothetical protein
VHWNDIVPDSWSPVTVPVSARAQSGRTVRINDAETVLSATLPVIEPPEVPSHVKLPDSDEPFCVTFIVILQPVENDSQPVRFHVPEASTGAVGDVGVDEHAVATNPITATIPGRCMVDFNCTSVFGTQSRTGRTRTADASADAGVAV